MNFVHMMERMMSWKYIVAVVVICLGAVYVSRQYQHAAKQCEEETAKVDARPVSPTGHAENAAECTQNAERHFPRLYSVFRWPDGTAVLALLLTLLVIAEQTNETRKSATAALRQVDYMAASERAHVIDTRVVVSSGAIDMREGSNQVFIQCAAKNEGRTPARVLGMNAILAVGPISNPGETWDKKLYWFGKNLTPQVTILADKSHPLNCPVPGRTAQPAQPRDTLPPPNMDGGAWFIHGVIKYWDIFSEAPRFTRFCYRYEERSGSAYGFYRAGGDGYNQQT
jgi:hypothetical protein